MKELDDLLKSLEKVKTPIYIKGKEYDGSNPYIINKINNLIFNNKIKVEDLEFDKTKLSLGTYRKEVFLFYKDLEDISDAIDKEYSEIKHNKYDKVE